jgi:hypothetical protein
LGQLHCGNHRSRQADPASGQSLFPIIRSGNRVAIIFSIIAFRLH